MSSRSRSRKKPASRPVVLIIRDGWGVSPSPRSMAEAEGNATILAQTPVHDKLLSSYPHTLLGAAGESVGLPTGQMGNSEVGHLNFGAGRIVYQEFTRISRAIEDGSFFEAPALKDVMRHVRANGSRLCLMGLCSDGGVHSHTNHLFALLELARRHAVDEVLIHAITDGRDTSPTGGAGYVARVVEHASILRVGRIASVTGRFYGMDRDSRWDRVAQAYNAIVKGEGVQRDDPVAAMRQYYADGNTDEFIPPTVITNHDGSPIKQHIMDGDGVIFFNFRADRARHLTRAITANDFHEFERSCRPKVYFVCLTEYDETFNLPIAFPQQQLTNILAPVLAAHGVSQLRIAETEKYAHVTFFFNGGDEQPVAGEERCLIPSPKVVTYDKQPEMSAPQVTAEVISRLKSRQYDVVILNYANPDMVGHTGMLSPTIQAVETVDECVGKVLATIEDIGGIALVTADHGNAERMLNEKRCPFTAHTSNRVHFVYVGKDHEHYQVRSGILADVAPTILELLGLPVPQEMTGRSLLVAR